MTANRRRAGAAGLGLKTCAIIYYYAEILNDGQSPPRRRGGTWFKDLRHNILLCRNFEWRPIAAAPARRDLV